MIILCIVILLQITSTLDRRYTLTNGKFTIENPQEDLDSGIYQCLVSNEMGSVLSNPVQISFGCKYSIRPGYYSPYIIR